jgi:hypothetical protein
MAATGVWARARPQLVRQHAGEWLRAAGAVWRNGRWQCNALDHSITLFGETWPLFWLFPRVDLASWPPFRNHQLVRLRVCDVAGMGVCWVWEAAPAAHTLLEMHFKRHLR